MHLANSTAFSAAMADANITPYSGLNNYLVISNLVFGDVSNPDLSTNHAEDSDFMSSFLAAKKRLLNYMLLHYLNFTSPYIQAESIDLRSTATSTSKPAYYERFRIMAG